MTKKLELGFKENLSQFSLLVIVNAFVGAMLVDFPKAIDDAILSSSEANQNQMMQLLSDPKKAADFVRLFLIC